MSFATKYEPKSQCGAELQRLFLDGLSKLVEQGKLKLEESEWITGFIDDLRLQPWVVFIEGPLSRTHHRAR